MISQIRAMGRYAYRSGKWANLVGIEVRVGGSLWHDSEPRPCFLVEFADGKTDAWVVYDRDAEYEFRAVLEPAVVVHGPDPNTMFAAPGGVFVATKCVCGRWWIHDPVKDIGHCATEKEA